MGEEFKNQEKYVELQLSLLKYGKITIEFTVKNGQIVHVERSATETLKVEGR